MRSMVLMALLCACSEYSVDSIEKVNPNPDDTAAITEDSGIGNPASEPGEDPEDVLLLEVSRARAQKVCRFLPKKSAV